MNKRDFNDAVLALRREGKSIRRIASETGAHRSRVERALKRLSVRTDPAVFVGRVDELSVLRDHLDQAQVGRGSTAGIFGEPGIGKTALALQLETLAESQAARVLWARCVGGQAIPPLWPVTAMIRDFIRSSSDDRLQAVLMPLSNRLVRLVPELRTRYKHVSDSDAHTGADRDSMLASVADFIERACDVQPTVMIFDDLHESDEPTFQLFRMLAASVSSQKLLLVGITRTTSGGAEPGVVGELERIGARPSNSLISLEPLNDSESQQLIEAFAKPATSTRQLDRITGMAEGNPLYLREYVRLFDSGTGAREIPGGDVADPIPTLPGAARLIIAQRVARLAPETLECLQTAAIAGREFDETLVHAAMSRSSVDDVGEALLDGEAHGIIERSQTGAGSHRFTHGLLVASLVDSIPQTRLQEIHGEIYDALLATFGPASSEHALALTHHLRNSDRATRRESDLVGHLVAAAEHALSLFGYERAADLFTEGMLLAAGRDCIRGEMLFGLSRAQVGYADSIDAFETLEKSFSALVACGNHERAIEVVAHPFPYIDRRHDQLIDRALALTDQDSIQAGAIQSRRGLLSAMWDGAAGKAEQAFSVAIRISQIRGDQSLLAWTRARMGTAAVYDLRYSDAVEHEQAALEAVEQIDTDADLAIHAAHHLGLACLSLGDVERATYYSEICDNYAGELNHKFREGQARDLRRSIAKATGAWQAAFDASDVDEEPTQASRLVAAADLAYIYAELGLHDQAEEALAEIQTSWQSARRTNRHLPTINLLVAALACTTGNQRHRVLAEEICSAQKLDKGLNTGRETVAAAARGLVAVLGADECMALDSYRRLDEIATARSPRPRLIGGPTGTMLHSIDRLLGLVATAARNFDSAVMHFADGITFLRKSGFKPELARTLVDFAELTTYRNSFATGRRTSEMLKEALGLATELEMSTLETRIRLLLAAPGRSPGPSGVAGDDLTDRELDVLGLVAEGRTNKQIATALFVTESTVATHLRSIFTKLGVSNRAEATARAITSSLPGTSQSVT